MIMTKSKIKLYCSFLLIVIGIIILLSYQLSFAQIDSIETKKTYGKGRIYTTDGSKIYFSSIALGKDFHIYQLVNTTLEQSISDEKTMKIEIQTGSHALEGGLSSAFIIGGFVAFIIIRESESNEERNKEREALGLEASYINISSDTKTALIVGSAVLGGLIGTAFGAQEKIYKTVYINPKYKFNR